MSHRFTGWVPTITGNLSFSSIGFGRSPEKDYKSFRAFPISRYTLVIQKRNKSDTLAPWLVDAVRGKRGCHYFIFAGTSTLSDNWETLSGPVFIVSPEKYEQVRVHLESLNLAANDEEYSYRVSHLVSCCARDIGTSHCFEIGATLARNGRLDIEINQSIYDIDTAEILASQAYFYLRDISHVHQHHSKSSDTILDVYPSAEDDVWRRETIYALYRWIIHRKRDRDLESYVRARGVLAYAKAFISLHYSEDTAASGQPRLLRYLVDEVEMSLTAGAEYGRVNENRRLSRQSIIITIWLTFLILSIAFLALLRDISDSVIRHRVEDSTWIRTTEDALVWIVSHPHCAAGGLVLAAALAVVPFFQSKLVPVRVLMLDLIRIAYSLPRVPSILLFLLAFLGFLYLSALSAYYGLGTPY